MDVPAIIQDDAPSRPSRRLIIVVVEPGEDPIIETDPPLSFALYEMVAALQRAVEILEEDDILQGIEDADQEDED